MSWSRWVQKGCVKLDVFKTLPSERQSGLTNPLWSMFLQGVIEFCPSYGPLSSLPIWGRCFALHRKHKLFGFISHLEMRIDPVLSCHVLHLSCLSKTCNFPEFSTKFTTKLPAAGPGQSCNIRNNGDLAALGVTLKDISHLAKCLWFILSSTNCIKTLD